MNPYAALEEYLRQVKRRVQATITARGLGGAGVAALLLTLGCVLFANHFGFANWSVISGRLALFTAVGAILALLLVIPLLRMRRRDGRRLWVQPLERGFPAFEERIQTFVDQDQQKRDNPMVQLLAEDTLRLAAEAPPSRIASSGPIWTFGGIALAAVAVLIYLGVAGPGYLGYGTARLWAGWLHRSVSELYQIVVEPGSITVRHRADLPITAKPVGFYSPSARLYAKFSSSARWEEAPMQRRLDDTGFEFVFAGIEEPLRYYIAAGGVKSPEYEVRVVRMPNVKRVRLTYQYPKWTGLAQNTEDPGGDVRAVAGTQVQVEVETDSPLAQGVLRVNNQASEALHGQQNWSRGRLAVEKNGQYFIGALYNGELVRLTDDFFIEAVPDSSPTVRVNRPGRDYRATSIEEVSAQFQAEDDFGLQSFELRYSVNGGPERKAALPSGGSKQSSASHLFPLENFSLVPGDIVAYYAAVRDAKVETKTDIYFIEVQPFEREFFQSQQMGAGGGEGGNNESSEISQRQKEIVAATWNLARDRNLDKQKAAEHAKTLSNIQSKLRDQARTLADRMKRRQMAGVNNEFRAFVENMEKAADAMGPAAEKLEARKWEEALSPEQKAVQHLLRAESLFRQIQVAFGRGGGGGGGGMGRDLAEMFELELDTEKNQYETGAQASAEQRERELDEALQKLRDLARRQEQLAEQRRREQTQTFDQRWQQEMLRREAEDLARRLQQMQQQQAQAGQNAQGQQQGRPQSGQQGSQSSANMQRALERLQQASRDMQSGNSAPPGQTDPGAQRDQRQAALERARQRLREAEQLLAGEARQQQGAELEEMERRAADLAERQQASAGKLQEANRQAMERMGSGQRDPRTGLPAPGQGMPREQAQGMSREKEQMLSELEALEKKMQDGARRMASAQPKASRKLRETIGEMQQSELPIRMKLAAELLRRGLVPQAAQREEPITRALNQLREGIGETRRLAQNEQQGGEGSMERALARVEQLRRQLDQALAAQQAGQRGEQQGQQPGNQGKESESPGQNGGGQGGEPQNTPGPGRTQAGRHGVGARWHYGGDASNRGDWGPNLPGQPPLPPERAFREGQIELGRIERGLRNDPEFAAEVEALRKEMQQLGSTASRFPGNPNLLNREQQKLLYEVEQLELLLRRKLDEKQGAQVRAATEQPVPEGYRKAVAEYFRRLSKEK